MKQKLTSSKVKYLVIFLFLTCFIIGIVATGWIILDYNHQSSSKVKNVKVRSSETSNYSPHPKETKEKKIISPVKIKRAATNHISQADNYAYLTENVRKAMKGPLNPQKPKVVFLTFDDGPSTINTTKILNILNQNQVHATFFLVGNRINPQTQELIKKEYDQGNGIGIHSFSHDYSILYPKNVSNSITILNEAQKTQNILKSFLGPQFNSRVWRYPGGAMSWKNIATSEILLQKNNYTWIDWNAANGDALGTKSPQNVVASLNYHKMSLQVYPASNVKVVLMHDDNSKKVTIAALPQIIKYYRDHGYKFGILK